MADVKVSLPLCPERMLNACGICAKLELICVRLVLRMCVRVSGSERLHDVGVSRYGGAGRLGLFIGDRIASRCGDAPGWSLAPVDIDIIER